MLPKHDGTFFLTSTYRQHWWKRAKGERNVSYCWFSFFVIHRQMASQQQIGHSWKLILRKAQQMAREESIRKRRKMVVKMVKPFLTWGYSRPFLQLTLGHVNTLILKARAGNLLSLIVSGTMILGWIWRDCHHQYVSWSYQVRLLHTKFLNSTFLILTDQQSNSMMVEEYESDTETIEDWEEWNTNLLNYFIFKINIVDGIDVTKINISWASWSCCFSNMFL